MPIVIPSLTHVELFLGASLALLLVPGPAVLYIIGRSIEQGRRAGLVSIIGIHAATLVHICAAAFGLSALLASSAFAFSVIKYAGAAYLIWLGLVKLFGRAAPEDGEATSRRTSHARLLRDGFMVNLLNPKTALFFLAFLPQFVDVELGDVAPQIVFLGLIFVALGLVTDGAYALVAGTAGGLLKRGRGYLRIERYVSGTLLVGLGVTAAFAGNRGK